MKQMLTMYNQDSVNEIAIKLRKLFSGNSNIVNGLVTPLVYTQVTSVAKSGISRTIRCYTVTKDLKIRDITYMVSTVTQHTENDNGIKVKGAGMDMAWNLVNQELSYALYNSVNKINHERL